MEEVRRVKVNFTFETFEGQDEVSSEASVFQREEVELAKPFPHMARDEDLSLAVLQGVGPSPVALYQPSVLERLLPLHTQGVAALRHSRAG